MHKNHVPCGEVKNLDDVFKTEMAKDKIRTEEINGVKTKRVSGIAFITEESVVLNLKKGNQTLVQFPFPIIFLKPLISNDLSLETITVLLCDNQQLS